MPASRELGERGVDVVDAVGDVVEARALALEELADRRVRPERAQELDVAVADVEQDRLDALLLDRLAVRERHRHRALIERQRRVQVVGGDADVIDQAEHPAPSVFGALEASLAGGSRVLGGEDLGRAASVSCRLVLGESPVLLAVGAP